MSTSAVPLRIVIIGSGFGGIGLAIRLKRAGIESFTILEKAASLGGTWRDNTYPGAACDIPAMLYCFSFEQKTDWSRKWSPQEEIRDYLEDVARRNGILPHVRFGVEMTGARFDEAAGTWTVRTATGEEIVADVLVSAIGQLHHPSIPALPGLDRFRGQTFHSARWNHGYDLSGKRVAVIGNAASAIQFIPRIAAQVRQLLILQRSANWMIPRGDRAYRPWEKRLLGRIPGLARAYRAWLWLMHEMWLLPLIRGHRLACRLHQRAATRYMRSVVADPALHDALVPDYPMGGKRILITDDYYQTLNRPNVEIVTAGIDHLTEDAVVTDDGRAHPVDAVIVATGFRTNPFLAGMRIEGLGGRTLDADWSPGATAYLGLTVSGYPNFFMLYGPNTNLGHNSIIFMLEAQIRYILSALRALGARGAKFLDVRPEVMAGYNARLQEELAGTAWAASGASWYKDRGRITNNWPGSTLTYWWRTHRIALADYRVALRTPTGGAAERAGEPPAGRGSRTAA